MKKLLLTIAAATMAAGAFAEGYQVNTLSAKQNGMAHTGVALSLGSESVIFNPGAVAFMDKNMEISGAISAISSKVNADIDGSRYTTDSKVSTPMNISSAFRIYDNLYAGISLYTPYGSSINWGRNWPAAVLTQSVDLKVFTVQPTISWKITPKFSIGAGLMIGWGSVNLTKGLVDSKALDQTTALLGAANTISNALTGSQLPTKFPAFNGVSPASATLTGNSELAWGVNVGMLYEVNEKVKLGAAFRSKLNMHVKAGTVNVEYANELAQSILQEELNNLNSTNFDASMPCPWVLTVGVSYKPIDKLTLAFDAQLNGWSAYKSLDITFDKQEQFNQHLTKDYHNATTWHLGAEYALTNRLDLRAGLMLDTSPCNKDYYNPETPGTTRIEPSCGLSFRPIKGLSIDLAFMYVNGVRVNDARGVYDNFLAKSYTEGLQTYNATLASEVPGMPGVTIAQALAAQGINAPAFPEMSKTGEIRGSYKLHAFIPSIGISYSF